MHKKSLSSSTTTRLVESKVELLKLTSTVKKRSAHAGFNLNLKSTKVVSTEEKEEVVLDGEKVEHVGAYGILSSSVPKL